MKKLLSRCGGLHALMLVLGAFSTFPRNALTQPDTATQFIQDWLNDGPMAGKSPSTTTFQERSLSSMYRVDREGASPIWVKCRPFYSSKGGYFPKPIAAPFTLDKYAWGKIRRQKSRELIDKINAEAGTILIGPYHKEFPTEYLLGNHPHIPHFLRENVVTFWQHIEGEQNPFCKSIHIWSPSQYPLRVIGQLVSRLHKAAIIADRILEASENPSSLKKALRPEYGEAVSEKILDARDALFRELGVPPISCEKNGKTAR